MTKSTLLSLTTFVALTPALIAAPRIPRATQGMLVRLDNQALECPLKHTAVKAEISGFLSRVTVTQEFVNNAKDKIEAVYVFPLPQMAAVDDMTMYAGARTVKGTIKRRDEARAIYDAARQAGKVAGLLDQERPNIFTQSIANIMPGEKVKIVISYVETLKYEDGSYEFAFPMVVGPRYIPGKTTGKAGGGWSYDTDRVPDASKITPIVTPEGTRAGHDVSIQVSVDAGVPIESLSAKTHDVLTERPTNHTAMIKLRDKAVIPNKDFILRWDVAGQKIQDTVLTHRGQKGGYFTMIFQPPDRVRVEDVTPKEIVFVLDTSGSMHGFPIEKAKEAMKLAIDGLNPRDTFNLITFAGDTHVLFPAPVQATPENLAKAQTFLASRSGAGGTEMMKAIRAALAPSGDANHVRVVCFMTDGYVGNEAEIIAEIQRYSNARVFSFGIGSSVNRYLLDKMAEQGRGEVEYVSLKDDGSAAAKRFHERVRNPLLTDISIEWNGLPVSEVFPARIPDLFSAKPVMLTGKFTNTAKGTVRLRGKVAGRPVVRDIPVNFPAAEPKHDVLAALWARTKIDNLSHQSEGNHREEITQLGLTYRLMTPFTSFVAVEETVVTEGGQSRRVEVPVEMPEGVSYEGIFGPRSETANYGGARQMTMASPAFMPQPSPPMAIRHKSIASRDMAREAEARPATPAAKLHPDLTGGKAAKLASNGKLLLMVTLSDVSDATLAQLKGLGFELVYRPTKAKVVVGRLALDKLDALSKLSAVTFIAPAGR